MVQFFVFANGLGCLASSFTEDSGDETFVALAPFFWLFPSGPPISDIPGGLAALVGAPSWIPSFPTRAA